MEDNGAHFFEGTEKLLEVWFSRRDETKGNGDLRTIPRCVSFRYQECPPGGGSTGHMHGFFRHFVMCNQFKCHTFLFQPSPYSL